MADHVNSCKCETCGEPSLYRCPGCSVRSCSVKCVKQHKVDYDCNGKRKSTEFVSMKDFNETNLVSDLHLLEDTSRKVRVVSDAKSDVSPLINNPSYATLRCNNNVLAKLKKAATLRNIDLRLCPFLSTRRRANSTHCTCRTVYQVNDRTKMYWHIKWIYGSLEYEERSVFEDLLLTDIIAKFFDLLDLGEPNQSPNFLLMRSKIREDCQDRDTISSDYKILMRVEDQGHGSISHELDMSLSLLGNLRGKTVVEHPVLDIVRCKDFVNGKDSISSIWLWLGI